MKRNRADGRPPRAGKKHRRRAPDAAARSKLQAIQLRKFRAMLDAVLPTNAFYQRKFSDSGVRARLGSIRTLDALRQLPFTSKQELLDDQAAHPPYGSDLTYRIEEYCRLHQSSGTAGVPLRWLDTPVSWQWFLDCWTTIYEVIGLEPDDRLFFPFSFGPFLGFWGAFEGAARLGNLCLPGGGMTSAARLRFMFDHRATVVACTPTYALRLAEVADEEGLDLADSDVRILLVAGEPGGSVPAIRARLETTWGARVFDHTGMTEIGALGIECIPHPGGVHLIETECIPEVIDPITTEPVEPGATGELVITTLGRWGSPLIRYRTGDLVRADAASCPCGRPWIRLAGGILGRSDDMMIIRGNNLHPTAVEELLRSVPGIAEFRCMVGSRGSTNSLSIEIEPTAGEAESAVALAARVARAFKDRFHFRVDVKALEPGALPRYEMKARRFIRISDESKH